MIFFIFLLFFLFFFLAAPLLSLGAQEDGFRFAGLLHRRHGARARGPAALRRRGAEAGSGVATPPAAAFPARARASAPPSPLPAVGPIPSSAARMARACPAPSCLDSCFRRQARQATPDR